MQGSWIVWGMVLVILGSVSIVGIGIVACWRLLSEAKRGLAHEFENAAHKIFEERSKVFADLNKTNIEGLLTPFREQIEAFQKRSNEIHESSIRDNSYLNAEIKKVLDIGLKIGEEANNLASALKGNAQQRGAWGEAQLRRTLEMSGLLEGTHFDVQYPAKDLAGKQKLLDCVIKLPDNKHIIIDSKVSLVDYDRALTAESSECYQHAMNDHVQAVRRHIHELAAKDYVNVLGVRAPSFVLMFMPIEPAYIEALKNDKELFEYGYQKGIILVSHTTLAPVLRVISQLWALERSRTEVREISEKAGDIYQQIGRIAERLLKLGNALNTVSGHYNDTIKALSGQQGLYGKVERFSRLSTKMNTALPVLEPLQSEHETEKLRFILDDVEKEAK